MRGILFAALLVLPAASEIRRVDLVNLSHTDFGFTDHPAVCRELQVRYLDIAIDATQAGAGSADAKFHWTAESTDAVRNWWMAAPPDRREELLRALQSGQIEITALPLNQAPFLDRGEWRQMLNWLPEELGRKVRLRAAVQNDVNGFPRAGALALLDHGVRYLWTGINADSGGPPFPRPSAFWWKMPDGRRLFVWLSPGYSFGYNLFEPKGWRQGPLPFAADTRYGPPRPGDFFRTDEASLRKANEQCRRVLARFEKAGYPFETVAFSLTNQWRIDNDPPFPPLAGFVAAWNRLGLKPELRLTTVSPAMEVLEKEMGARVPVYEGEWTDWWANGAGSDPRAVAASRFAKRYLTMAASPLWGEVDSAARRTMGDLYRDLCLFDEHTWGGSNSVALPDSLDTLGQFGEKAQFAYRPMARAEWLLSQRVRTRLLNQPEGLYVANTSPQPFSGWIEFPVTAFRGDFQSVQDPQTGERRQLFLERGLRPYTRPQSPDELTPENDAQTFPDNVRGMVARFWMDGLAGNAVRKLAFGASAVKETASRNGATVKTDGDGWPSSATWDGMASPLFLPGLGDCTRVRVKGFAPRWVVKNVWAARTPDERERMRRETLEEVSCAAGPAERRETPHTLIYTQRMNHPGLKWAVRQLELWKAEPRARLTLRINRLSADDPEIWFVSFPLPPEGAMPVTSNGGQPFTPFRDQLAGTCRDYFAIDGWVQYTSGSGAWLWVTRDAPLVTFGPHSALAKRTEAPKDPQHVRAMIFNNLWYTNFVGNAHGAMEFQFDLVWRKSLDDPAGMAEMLSGQPAVCVNPRLRESPAVLRRLFQP